jgi:hypothetical protein
MNKMHTLAKIMLSGIGIFFAIRLLSTIPTLLWVAITQSSDLSLPLALFWTAFLGLCLAALLYVFLYRREHLAKRIVGAGELAEPDSHMLWLPAALRLVCIAAGLYSLNLVTWNTTRILATYLMYKSHIHAHTTFTRSVLSTESLLSCLVMAALGIYLVCGAPHFVRWQLKKTLKQCKQFAEKETTAAS